MGVKTSDSSQMFKELVCEACVLFNNALRVWHGVLIIKGRFSHPRIDTYNNTFRITTTQCQNAQFCCWRNFDSSAIHVILKPTIKDPITFFKKSPLKPFVFQTVNCNKREDNTVHTSRQKTPHLFLKQRKLEQHWRNDTPHYTLSILRASNTGCLQQAHANTLRRYLNAARPYGRHTSLSPADIVHRLTNTQAPIKDDSCHYNDWNPQTITPWTKQRTHKHNGQPRWPATFRYWRKNYGNRTAQVHYR